MEPYIPPRGPAGFPGRSRYTPAQGRAICAALAEGFTLRDICRDPQVGVRPNTVYRWAQAHPEFGAAFWAAVAPRQTETGLRIGRGRRGTYCPQIAQAIVDRLLQGRALISIATDPDMPHVGTIRTWRRHHMDFHIAVQNALRFSIDLMLDEVVTTRDRPERAPRVRQRIALLAHHGHAPFAASFRPVPTQEQMDAARGPKRARRRKTVPGIGHNSRRGV